MNGNDAVVEGVNTNAPGNTTSILFAYVDTYIGKHLVKQFLSKLKPGVSYNITGCTWNKEGVQGLAARGAAEDSANDSTHVNLSQYGGGGAVESSFPIGIENLSLTMPSPKVIWRGDVTAMRRAYIECDKIIVEMRQAQDVFDMIHLLTKKEILRPKRIVVISSILTWYATPPLQVEPPEAKESEGSDAGDGRSGHSADEEDAEEAEEAFDGASPVGKREEEALLGPVEPGEGDEAGDGRDIGEDAEEMETFTEDQYNRRVPHVKFYNWRDAERAVAAAHGEKHRLETFVVFAGLPYGEGDGPLEPLFTQAWSRGVRGLPIYGDGKQFVPTVHVRDLATFTMRLIDAEELPASRYLFGIDSGTATWGRMIHALNRAFGGEVTYTVRPEDYVLHRNVELFTMNLRVDNQTMREIMPEDEDWVAQAGFVENATKIAHEYVVSHHLEPMRFAVLGPPLSGKSTTATELAKRLYHLPVFNIEQVVESYKKHAAGLQNRLDVFRQRLFTAEKTRRLDVKRRAYLRGWSRKPDAENGEEEDEADAEENEAAAEEANAAAVKDEQRVGFQVGDGGARFVQDMEVDDVNFVLTEEESSAVNELVDEWLSQSERVQQLRETTAAMERVLSMRVRQQAVAQPDALAQANPKRRRENARSKRPSKPTNKSREEGASVSENDATLVPNLPFHDRALALMLRWRLSRADCRNQGYVLDGFPETVAQARLVFHDESLEIPATTDNASRPVTPLPAEPNVAPDTCELCNEARLPDYVIVLDAADNFLLDRLALMASAVSDAGNTSAAAAAEEKRPAQFEEALATYRRQFLDTDYSLVNFFECAKTEKSALMPGGRAPTILSLRSDKEPLGAPPPPASAFAVPPISSLGADIARVVGAPRNTKPTPQEHYEDEVRERHLLEEEHQETVRLVVEQREREVGECDAEYAERGAVESAHVEVEMADRAALERRKAPMRDYLQRNIVPLISKGLVEVCKTRPKDPVDFLAEWLTRHNPLDDTCLDL